MKPSTLTTTIDDPVEHSFRLDDPFNGFFERGNNWMPPEGGLLDNLSARKWFSLLNWGVPKDLYTYQQPLQGKCGSQVEINGQLIWMLSSYDYLGLIGHPDIEAAAAEAVYRHGTGTGGVRLLTGTNCIHRELEREIADFKQTEAAVTFSSGYLANLAIVTALLQPGDQVIIDSLAHRSIVDACRLAGVRPVRFCHNDLNALHERLEESHRAKKILVIIEGVYSMDGDVPPLQEIVALKQQYRANLMIDESHSFGVMGASGRGIDEYFGIPASDIDIWMGSLSKTIPSNGGFVAGSQELIIYLQHGAAPYMFSAALCPPAAAAAAEALNVIRREPERLEKVRQNANYLHSQLKALGYDTGASQTHIIPVILGKDSTTYQFARDLLEEGILASAIIFPAVPRGSARLRLCATASQNIDMLQEVVYAFRKHARDRDPHA